MSAVTILILVVTWLNDTPRIAVTATTAEFATAEACAAAAKSTSQAFARNKSIGVTWVCSPKGNP